MLDGWWLAGELLQFGCQDKSIFTGLEGFFDELAGELAALPILNLVVNCSELST